MAVELGPRHLSALKGCRALFSPPHPLTGTEEVSVADRALTRTPPTLRKVLKGCRDKRREVTHCVMVIFPQDWKFPGH